MHVPRKPGRAKLCAKQMLWAGLLAGSLAVLAPGVRADGDNAKAGQAASPAPAAAKPAPSAPRIVSRSERGEMYYMRRFGVDHLQVRSTASGASLQFRYRVVDEQKASVLNDKRLSPYMVDWQTGNRLQVPTMERIGALRQVSKPEAGREYWMVFSNPGKQVKPGQKVDVVVGSFRVEGLTVE